MGSQKRILHTGHIPQDLANITRRIATHDEQAAHAEVAVVAGKDLGADLFGRGERMAVARVGGPFQDVCVGG
jgi:hypothetical protein